MRSDLYKVGSQHFRIHRKVPLQEDYLSVCPALARRQTVEIRLVIRHQTMCRARKHSNTAERKPTQRERHSLQTQGASSPPARAPRGQKKNQMNCEYTGKDTKKAPPTRQATAPNPTRSSYLVQRDDTFRDHPAFRTFLSPRSSGLPRAQRESLLTMKSTRHSYLSLRWPAANNVPLQCPCELSRLHPFPSLCWSQYERSAPNRFTCRGTWSSPPLSTVVSVKLHSSKETFPGRAYVYQINTKREENEREQARTEKSVLGGKE